MAGLDIENRPWYVALAIGIVIAGLLVFACENYIFKDIERNIAGRTKDLEILKKKVQEGKIAESRLTQFREEAERLETELQRLIRILPTLKQTDELIKKLKSLTERGNFRLVTFQPLALVKKEFFSEWGINVSLQASYHELALFFDRLSRFSRIINVESLQASAYNRRGSEYSITTSFTMKTFIYGEVKETKQEGARR